MVVSNRPGEIRPGSSGKIIPRFEAKIVDMGGRSVPQGDVGTLLIKGDSISDGETLEEARENLRDAILLLLEMNQP